MSRMNSRCSKDSVTTRTTGPVTLFDIPIYPYSYSEIISVFDRCLLESTPTHVVTLNSEIFGQTLCDSTSREWLSQADIVLPDGAGICKAISLLHHKEVERITGIDLVLALLERQNNSFYLVGATELTINEAYKRLNAKNHILGYHHGYLNTCDYAGVIQDICATQPDFVLVGMGFPKQDQFIAQLKGVSSRGVFIGVGGAFDVLSGHIERAPQWLQNYGCEWLYRGLRSPQRIIRWRYIIVFLVRILRDMLKLKAK